MAEENFTAHMKLKILRSMIPDCMRYLVPSKIVLDLSPYVLDEDQVREIVEKERQCRADAVRLLMDAVVAKKEDGLSYFIHALEQADSQNGRFLNPLLDQPEEGSVNHPGVNDYFTYIIRCLRGSIIRQLAPAQFNKLLRELVTEGLIDDGDLEELQEMSPLHKRGVQLFLKLPQFSEQWPLKFFRALNRVSPELAAKCDPQGEWQFEDMEMDKEAEASVTSPATADSRLGTASEETAPKRPRTSDDEDTPEDVSMEIEEELLGSEEESEAEFSDGEEKEDEGTEKGAQAKALSLRQYQYELAEPAVQGKNTIICAPTGSGKTRVALYIVKEHLASAGAGAVTDRKVVFMARTVPLVSQQFKIFEKYLPNFRCGMIHGETADHEALHLMLDDFDILVLTPKILENHLKPDKIPSLARFSLIILDECHHTRKGEPYNSVMKHYLQSKKTGETGLPQIVGLTASIGVEKASTVDGAESSIIDIMANLDVSSITKVHKHIEELIQTVPTPDERLEELTPREDDEVSRSLRSNMVQVERLLDNQVPVRDIDPEFLGVRDALRKRPAQRNSQKYGQWAVKVCDQARKVHIPDQPNVGMGLSAERIEKRRLFSQNVQLLAETLIAYNEALDVHELSRPVDVLDHLKNKLDPRHSAVSPDPTVLERQLLNLFQGLQKKLKKAAAAKNPNLRKLSGIIEEIMSGQWATSRVMVFVRTRATCQALCSWLNSDDNISSELRELKASPFTGTGAHQELGGMTQHEQEGVIEKFREGDVKLLVCTTVGQEGMDIPDCNLVIRYNHVGNEVATVQTRGRSRKAGGVSVLLAMPDVIRKERINKKRVEIMNKAIDNVNQMRSKEVSNKVRKAQNLAMDKDEMRKIASLQSQKSRSKKGSFTLACARCRKVRVSGDCIRTIDSSHHVVIGNHLVDRQEVSIKPRTKPKQVDSVQFTGEIICSKCPVTKQNLLGTVLKYQEAEFLTLKAESWLVLDEKQRVQKSGKWKWKDMGYAIPELTPRDMSVHLGLNPEGEEEEEEGAVGGASV